MEKLPNENKAFLNYLFEFLHQVNSSKKEVLAGAILIPCLPPLPLLFTTCSTTLRYKQDDFFESGDCLHSLIDRAEGDEC